MRIRPSERWLARVLGWAGTVLCLLVFLWIVLMLIVTEADADAPSILREHCYKCHGTSRTDWDASSEESARSMAESILEMIADDQMPPKDLPKLSAAEKATLREWFAAEPSAEKPAERKLLDDDWVVRQIQADAGRGDSLYVSLANLHNAGATKQQIWDAQGAVSKAANLLSTAPQIAVPRKVDERGIVLRIDTALLNWDDADAAELFEEYPYAELSKGFIRGDWFVVRALSAPLYYRLLGIPNSQRDLDAILGIDRQRFIDRNLVRRAGITTSRVAFHNRAIEWSPSNTGAVRLTYDTANEERERQIVANPLGPVNNGRFANRAFRHDAAEYIGDLPNGLHLYAAFNGQGVRQDKVPENIASDPSQFSGSTSIIPGISCASCHKTGIQSPVSDVVRSGAPLFGVGELAKVQALYPTKEEFAGILARDEARYLAAVKQAIEPFKSVEEPIGPTALEYNKPLDIAKVALESNTTVEQLRAAILADADLQAGGLRPLTENQTITREAFESLETGQSPAQRIAELIGR